MNTPSKPFSQEDRKRFEAEVLAMQQRIDRELAKRLPRFGRRLACSKASEPLGD